MTKVVLRSQTALDASLAEHGVAYPTDAQLTAAGVGNLIGFGGTNARAKAVALAKWAADRCTRSGGKTRFTVPGAPWLTITAKPGTGIAEWRAFALSTFAASETTNLPMKAVTAGGAPLSLGQPAARPYSYKVKNANGTYTPSAPGAGTVPQRASSALSIDWPCLRSADYTDGVTPPAGWATNLTAVSSTFATSSAQVTLLPAALSGLTEAAFLPPSMSAGNAMAGDVRLRRATVRYTVAAAGEFSSEPALTAEVSMGADYVELLDAAGENLSAKVTVWVEFIEATAAAMARSGSAELRAILLRSLLVQGLQYEMIRLQDHAVDLVTSYTAVGYSDTHVVLAGKSGYAAVAPLKHNTLRFVRPADASGHTIAATGRHDHVSTGQLATLLSAGLPEKEAKWSLWSPMPSLTATLRLFHIPVGGVDFAAMLVAARTMAAADEADRVRYAIPHGVAEHELRNRADELTIDATASFTMGPCDSPFRYAMEMDDAYDRALGVTAGLETYLLTNTDITSHASTATQVRTDTATMVAKSSMKFLAYDGKNCGIVDAAIEMTSTGQYVLKVRNSRDVEITPAHVTFADTTPYEEMDVLRAVFSGGYTAPSISAAEEGTVSGTATASYTAVTGPDPSTVFAAESEALYVPHKLAMPLRDPWVTNANGATTQEELYPSNAPSHFIVGVGLVGNRDASDVAITDIGENETVPGGTVRQPQRYGATLQYPLSGAIFVLRATRWQWSPTGLQFNVSPVSLQQKYTPADPRGIPLSQLMPVYTSAGGAPSWPDAFAETAPRWAELTKVTSPVGDVTLTANLSPTIEWRRPHIQQGALVYSPTDGGMYQAPETLEVLPTYVRPLEMAVARAASRIGSIPFVYPPGMARPAGTPVGYSEFGLTSFVGAWRKARLAAGRPALETRIGIKQLDVSYVRQRPDLASPPHPLMDAGRWTQAASDIASAPMVTWPATPREVLDLLPIYEGLLKYDVTGYVADTLPATPAWQAGQSLGTATHTAALDAAAPALLKDLAQGPSDTTAPGASIDPALQAQLRGSAVVTEQSIDTYQDYGSFILF